MPTPNVYYVCLPNADDVRNPSRASSCFTVVCGMLTRRVCTRLRLCEVIVQRMLPVANSRLSLDSESAPWSSACTLPFFFRYSVRL